MTCELIHRALIDPLRHANVDAELKQLKLASRRLHQTLTVLAAEQQLLQRLYYKSKNQHRGALFWRNVGEILRYLRKLDVPDLQESVAKLRNTFYGSTVGSSAMKGSWTHCPTQSYLTACSSRFKTAMQLLAKLSEVCIRAYKSFHRSMQSAAFLQILLMFVAVSSRTRCLSLDLQKAMEDIHSSTTKLSETLFPQLEPGPSNLSEAMPISVTAEIDNITAMEINDLAPTIDLNTCKTRHTSILSNESQASVTQKITPVVTTAPELDVVAEAKVPKKVIEVIKQNTPKFAKSSKDLPPKKKKRKLPSKDEIDDIFGF